MLEVVTLLNKHKIPFNLLNTLRRRIAIEFVKLEENHVKNHHSDDHNHDDNMDMSIIEPIYQETIGPLLSDTSRQTFFSVF